MSSDNEIKIGDITFRWFHSKFSPIDADNKQWENEWESDFWGGYRGEGTNEQIMGLYEKLELINDTNGVKLTEAESLGQKKIQTHKESEKTYLYLFGLDSEDIKKILPILKWSNNRGGGKIIKRKKSKRKRKSHKRKSHKRKSRRTRRR